MPVDRKSTKRKAKTLADKKVVEQILVARLIEEAANLPGMINVLLRSEPYKKLAALQTVTWTLVVRASAKRGKEFLEVCADLIKEHP